jgi:hypothetical protein
MILRFENFLTIFKFFSLLQINIFVMFLYYFFLKNMLRLCLVVTPNPRNFITFNFFSLLQNNIFFLYFKAEPNALGLTRRPGSTTLGESVSFKI